MLGDGACVGDGAWVRDGAWDGDGASVGDGRLRDIAGHSHLSGGRRIDRKVLKLHTIFRVDFAEHGGYAGHLSWLGPFTGLGNRAKPALGRKSVLSRGI